MEIKLNPSLSFSSAQLSEMGVSQSKNYISIARKLKKLKILTDRASEIALLEQIFQLLLDNRDFERYGNLRQVLNDRGITIEFVPQIN